MGRANYNDEHENDWSLICWRGQVASAIRGKRGQAFLRELIEALNSMPEKRLIRNELWNGEACAIGVVGVRRGVDMITLDPEDYNRLSEVFGIAHQLVREIEYENDEVLWRTTPEQRWQHMREWARRNLK